MRSAVIHSADLVSHDLSKSAATLIVMARRKRGAADLTGIRQRGDTYQVRIFGGTDPVTGKQVMLTGSADSQDAAIELRDKFRTQVRERTAVRTGVTLGYLLDEWLAGHQVEATTRASYSLYVERFIRPALGDQTLARLAQLGPRPYEQLYAQLRHCRRRCAGKSFIEHRTSRKHECDERCAAHVCTPLAASSIRQCHAVLSSAYAAAVRWGWIAFNPMEAALKPRPPVPQPDPLSPEDAARVVAAAWAQDEDWGMLVWLTLVTGARRGELLALRWEDVDLTKGVLTIRHSLSERGGAAVVKDTKTHQMRRISLDEATAELLNEHKKRGSQRCDAIGASLDETCFVFSYAEDQRRPCSPSGVTHRYQRMVRKLGLRTRLHAMRHYSATELLSSGVDLRTVAGRLGHGGGGAITLRVYAAWVASADQEAAKMLAARLPLPRRADDGPSGSQS
jgi:integrase